MHEDSMDAVEGYCHLADTKHMYNPYYLNSWITLPLTYGIWFALLTGLGFSLMGLFASRLAGWLQTRPNIVSGLNIGAGVTFVASGLAVAALKQR